MGERMSRENLDLARLIYKVSNRRDLDTMLALAHDEVEIGSASSYGAAHTATTGCVADRTTPRCPLQLRRWRRETDERRPRQTHLGIQARIRTSFERQGLMRHLGARLRHVGGQGVNAEELPGWSDQAVKALLRRKRRH
jgi:hypothetical protein